MLVFDLSHDRMARVPLTMVSDVQQAVIVEKARYAQAARKIGLNPRERDEMERRLSRGEVKRTTLPVRLDAMAGLHRGRVYAVREVRVLPGQSAYVVALDDGKRVYIPVVCGNLSLVRGTPRPVRIAHTNVHTGARRTLARRLVPPGEAGAFGALQPPAAFAAPQLPVTDAPAATTATGPLHPSGAMAPAGGARVGGLHVPLLGLLGGALGAVGAFISGGSSSSSVADDTCF